MRLQQHPAALDELRLAAKLDPSDPNLIYVYSIALNSLGQSPLAIQTLKNALKLHPDHREILSALVSFLRDSADMAGAERYAEQLRSLDP